MSICARFSGGVGRHPRQRVNIWHQPVTEFVNHYQISPGCRIPTRLVNLLARTVAVDTEHRAEGPVLQPAGKKFAVFGKAPVHVVLSSPVAADIRTPVGYAAD